MESFQQSHNTMAQGREPIAIIGIGCRFPGNANGPDSFWRLLCDGVDTIQEVPTDRWSLREFYDPEPGIAGKTNTRWGGFIKGIDQFDAGFFGISPREAASMDPQQRTLLEVAYEAIEDGGQALERLAGSRTGVFIGISMSDYNHIQSSPNNKDTIETHISTGTVTCIAANRISYCFDLRGPSLAIDTACSSSLVAVHLACQSLWNKESTMAFAGGVNALICPEPFIAFSRLSMLSPDGRCKAFDANGNGFVRAEGAGIVLLKPLSRALADGDQIYALVLGTVANQDGRTNGITVPSEEAQAAMIREACEQAGVAPEKIQYAETHGTGTSVGDPIEARALGAVLSPNRPTGDYCIIGSVKTNIGHLEAGAGIAGLIKVALSLKHKMIPPSLHLENPNPHIQFDDLKLRVQQALGPWPSSNGPALATVNSFGFGGTNANAIVSEAPRREREDQPEKEDTRKVCLVPLSAQSSEALKSVARTYRDFLNSQSNGMQFSLKELAYNLSLRRTHHNHRLSVVATTTEELRDKLEAFLAGENRQGTYTGSSFALGRPKLAFVFSGQGPQWWAMGRELLEHEPLFRRTIEKCDGLLAQHASWSLLEELSASEERSRIHMTAIGQPAIFALQVALAELWRSWGVIPAAVLGHSVGEIAAAHIAGVLSLEDAVRVIYHRGRCMDIDPSKGKMLGAGLTRKEAESFIHGLEDRVSIAAINSPSSVTFSGDGNLLDELARKLEERGVFSSFLRVNYAFHSPHMDPVVDELLNCLRDLKPAEASLPLYSTVSGQRAGGPELNADYMSQSVRNSVRFADAVLGAIDDGYNLFIEVGPHPALSSYVTECLQVKKVHGHVLPSLRRKEAEQLQMLGSLGALYTVGYPVEWSKVYPARCRHLSIPSYPWQHEPHWHEDPDTRESRLGTRAHPLLGRRLKSANPTWSVQLHRTAFPYLHDHKVQGHVVFPAVAYLEMAFASARETFGSGTFIVENVDIQKALFLTESAEQPTLQTTIYPNDSSFAIHSRPRKSDNQWTLHATGRVRLEKSAKRIDPVDWKKLQQVCPEVVTREECYRKLRSMGLQFGTSFQGIEQIWRRDGEALGAVQLSEPLEREASEYLIHPALFDSCLQVLSATLKEDPSVDKDVLLLPVHIEEVRFFGRPQTRVWAHARVTRQTTKILEGDIQVLDESGNVLVDLRGLRNRPVDTVSDATSEITDTWIYEFQWQPKPRAGDIEMLKTLDFPPSLEAMKRQLQDEADTIRGTFESMSKHAEAETALNQLCAAYILNALHNLGWNLIPHQQVVLGPLAQQLGIPSHYYCLLEYCLDSLASDGVLNETENGWTVSRVPEHLDINELWRGTLHTFPALYAELLLTSTYGQHLAEVLQGRVKPTVPTLQNGTSGALEHVYQNSPFSVVPNLLVAKIVSLILEHLPEGRRLRILDVGGAAAGALPHILANLPPDRVEYVFADDAATPLQKAEQKFREFPYVKCQSFDIKIPPGEQGFAPNSFDLILASNALHKVRSPHQALGNLKTLLNASGMLICSEAEPGHRWLELILGLAEEWWSPGDGELDSTIPLLPRENWIRLLREAEFDEPFAVPGLEGIQESIQSVFVARNSIRKPGAHAEQGDLTVQTPSQSGRRWLVFADTGGTGQQLSNALTSRGDTCMLVSAAERYRRLGEDAFEVSPDRPEDFRQLLAELTGPKRQALHGVVHCWNLDAQNNRLITTASLDTSTTTGCQSVISFVQAWAGLHNATSPQFWLVTAGAQPVGGGLTPLSIEQSPACGLGRVIMNEHPDLHCRLVDLSPRPTQTEIDALVAEFMDPDDEDEIALRGEARYAQRLVRKSLKNFSAQEMKEVDPTSEPVQLENTSPGMLDNLTLRQTRRQKPGKGQVEIQVAATALNFRDVMKALGIYPTDSDDDMLLGDECSGTVVAVGDAVDHLQVGAEVVAIAPGSFCSFVTTDAHFVVRKPPHLSFQEAVTLPVAYLTAYYALHDLGRMGHGDRVLIHAAAGGVGLAAVQLAQLAGAEVYATAGSPEKRAFVRSLGVPYVMDSRSLSFADEIMEFTDHRGVDIVLNSLAGEAIHKGLSCLAPGGRFLEIGKRDIYQNTRLGLRIFKNNISYSAIDLASVMADRPLVARKLLSKLADLFERGQLHPLPYRTYPIANVVSAFRDMAQAKHIGKIVVSMRGGTVTVAPPPGRTFSLAAVATYLITGGLSGFGLATARWMVERGARHLVLLGRSGVTTNEAKEAIAALEKKGARIAVERADVSRERDVARVLATVAQSLPPLRGVVHAAMVLDDSIILQLNRDRLKKVLEPKVLGAWNLHALTRDIPLDFFILFSSGTTMVGNAGQGNYVAANAFLDALAHQRHRMNLPALTVNWGFLSDTGYVSRNSWVGKHLESLGVRGFSTTQAFEILEKLLMRKETHIGVMDVDWQQWAKLAPNHRSPRFSALVSPNELLQQEPDEHRRVRDHVLAARLEERQQILESHLKDQVARVLGMSPSKIEPEQPLNRLGLDSLMMIELKNRVEKATGSALSTVELMRGPTIRELAKLLLEQLTAQSISPSKESEPVVQSSTPEGQLKEVHGLLQNAEKTQETRK